MAKISVIIPVYNAQEYLKDCLDSVLNQTFKDIEVICVNDNSTDDSLNILKDYERKNSRITILTGKGTGAGGARNVGLDCAKGEYLLFLDADDFFDPMMLEEMYNRAVETNSDIVVCDADKYDTINKQFINYKDVTLPSTIKKAVFSGVDYKDEIFCCLKNQVWNKLFKTSFIKSYNLKFQEIKRCNDTYFCKCALINASRISIVRNIFVHYRFGLTSNLQSNNIDSPKDFIECFMEIKKYLTEKNLYAIYESSFKKFVIDECDYYLQTLPSYPKAYFCLKQYLLKNILPKIGISKNELPCLSNIQIFLIWLFSIKNYRFTEYKIINILGIRIRVKKKNKGL